ncbi:MAG: hypothetical protein ABEJ05_11580 [Haloglomus sp.]
MTVVPLQAIPLPVAAIFGLVGLALVALGFGRCGLAVRYRSLCPTPIGSLSEVSGRVAVSGTARRTDEVLTAPITHRDCFAYARRVSDLRTVRGIDGSVETWRTSVDAGRDAVLFLVEDALPATAARRVLERAAHSEPLGTVRACGAGVPARLDPRSGGAAVSPRTRRRVRESMPPRYISMR